MEDILVRFGPLAVLVGAGIEGDVTMILAGVVVHLGLLDGPIALVAGCLGAFASDCLYFALGRRGGVRLRQTRAYRRVAPLVERIAGRLVAGAIVLARLIYGTRIASLVFWGVHGLGWPRFAALDLIGCALWAVLFGGLGFLLSNSAAALIGEVKVVERHLLLALVVAIAIVLAMRAVIRRRLTDARSSPAPGRRPRP